MTTFAETQYFEIEHCCKCGIAFAMPSDFKRRKISNKEDFYCPSGHCQHYLGMSDKDRAQRLSGQLDMERTRRHEAEKAADYASRSRKAVSTRLKKMKHRVGHGVCPCCKRTFKALADHMATKHPGYADTQDRESGQS